MTDNFDFVVAGSGAGGACVAARLVQSGARVLVLEKGGFARPEADAADAIGRYYGSSGLSCAFGNTILPIPTGTTVGGTTTINSGTCLRPPENLLRRWEAASSGRFRAREFERFVDEAWAALKVRRAPENTMSRCTSLVMDGLKRLGVRSGALLDRCEDGCVGSGRCCFVCPSGGKLTSYRAFLQPLNDDRRLRLRRRSQLISVRPARLPGEPVRLRYVELDTGAARTAQCRALVLSAGALATPYFVRRYNLGAGASAAGDGLTVHPASKIFAYFKEPVEGWRGVPQGFGFSDPVDEAIRYEGVYTPPEIAAITLPLEGRRLRWWMDRYRNVATFGFMIRDEARGRVRYPVGPAHPFVRYGLAPEDARRMVRAARFVAEIFFAAGAERVVLPFNRPDNEVAGLRELQAFDFQGVNSRELHMMAFHPLGTCAMGKIVDENLRACPGIYLCDGSVVPESLGVNPQITIYAFALRLAAHLTEKMLATAGKEGFHAREL
ncbi:MAG: GMC family oxidoreductase [Elusimicrobia bacterium]|nr:GMC family oxidoreductase [Elusimicrobiota bacterium]